MLVFYVLPVFHAGLIICILLVPNIYLIKVFGLNGPNLFYSMRTNRSKLRKPPQSSQLHSSIVIIGVSRDTKDGGRRAAEAQFGTIDAVKRYLNRHHQLGDLQPPLDEPPGDELWQPPLDELCCERGQPHEQAGPPTKSSEATPRKVKNARDSAARYGRLLAGKLRPVSIVDNGLYDQSVKTLKCITPDRQGNLVYQNGDGAETDSSDSRLFVGEKPKSATIGQQLVHFRSSIGVGVQVQVAQDTLHASSRTVVSNRDETKGCAAQELRTLFRNERGNKSNGELCRLTTRSRSYGKSPLKSRRPPHSREPFKTVCPSRSLHCFLRSKQRRYLHYRKAVLGEGITCLPYEDNTKWSSDYSIVHSN